MKAEVLSHGGVRLVIMPHPRVRPPAYEEFQHLIGFLSEAREGWWRRRDEFAMRVGAAYEEVCSLSDELLLIRYDLLGTPRPYDPSSGRFSGGIRDIRKTSTEWDEMPKIGPTLLSDGRLSLTLRRGELGIFANCVDVTLDTLRAKVSRGGREEFWIRRSMTPEEAEGFRDELRHPGRKTRIQSS
jgi:hypothetical protein